MRHYLGVRYDARSGVFDWDYNMKLTEMVRLAHHAVVSSVSASRALQHQLMYTSLFLFSTYQLNPSVWLAKLGGVFVAKWVGLCKRVT